MPAGPRASASAERHISDVTTRWYQFCICDIVSMLCTSMPVCARTLSQFFKRGPYGKESQEGKEGRESYQEGGKEDVKKEVVVSTTEIVRLRMKNGRKTNLFKGSERRVCTHSGIEERQDKIGPLCRRRPLYKGPVFCLCPGPCNLLLPREIEAARPRRCAARFTRARSGICRTRIERA
jgi:hypothetical protein